jgi:hypothetical protein
MEAEIVSIGPVVKIPWISNLVSEQMHHEQQ